MEERFKLLILSGIILFTFYYTYDLPAALNSTILKEKDNKSSKIIYLYVIYSIPNIVAPILVGTYVKIRASRTAFYLTTLSCIGQFVFTLGVYFGLFSVMLLGRFIYGIGGECFLMVQNKRITGFFKGKELAISLSILVSMGRFGTICNFILSPIAESYFNGFVSCSIGFVLTLIGVIVCYIIDNSEDIQIYELIENQKEESLEFESNVGTQEEFEMRVLIEELRQKENNEIDYNLVVDPIYACPWTSSEEKTIRFEKADVVTGNTKTLKNEIVLETNKKHNDKLKNEKRTIFRMFLVLIFVFASIWGPFYNLAPMIISSKFDLKNTTSGKYMAFLEGIAMVVSFFSSAFADYLGFKLILILLGSILLTTSHVLINLRLEPVFISFILMGFASPLISSYWPCIPIVVPFNKITDGFASVACVINIASTLTPILISYTSRMDENFFYSEVLFICLSSFAILLSSIIIFLNGKNDVGLNKPEIVKI